VYKEREVYEAKSLKDKYPAFFKGCTEKIKNVVEKHSIPSDVVFYAIKTSTGWNESNADVRKAALLIDKDWADENIPAILKEGITSSTGKVYLPAPEILKLKDEEKFTDDDGNIYEIEIRGERIINNCFFKAFDLETMLEMSSIKGTIQDSRSSFVQGEDYEIFITTAAAGSDRRRDMLPTIFLTYFGLTRLLFVRRHPIARKFQKWATNIIFVTHLHASKPLDIMKYDNKTKYNYWKDVLLTPSVVYLFKLGKIKELRNSLKIDLDHKYSDDLWVVKFGRTTQLKARTNQHEEHYGLLPHVELNLVLQTRFDVRYLSDAENTIKEHFRMTNTLITDNAHYKELAVASDENITTNIKYVYDTLEKENVAYMLEVTESMEKYLELSILDKLPTNLSAEIA